MIVKKSTIILLSAITTFLVWGAYWAGINRAVDRVNLRQEPLKADLGVMVSPGPGVGLKTVNPAIISIEPGVSPTSDGSIQIWRDGEGTLHWRDPDGSRFLLSKHPDIPEFGEVETPVIDLGRIEAWKLWDVSFYDNCKYCIDKKYRNGRFASGKKVYFGGIAMGKQYKFGTKVVFEKPILGRKTFICEDRGRLVYGNKVDIFVNSHKLAKKLGRKNLYGKILLDK